MASGQRGPIEDNRVESREIDRERERKKNRVAPRESYAHKILAVVILVDSIEDTTAT